VSSLGERDLDHLFERVRRTGDSRARELLVRRYTPLARSLAARYARGTEPLDDLFQAACLGLLKAIDRYDPARGTAFASFAVPTMLGELKRHFRDTTWAVRIPHSVHDLAMRVRRAKVDLSQLLGREPTLAELATALGAPEDRLAEAVDALAAYELVSLEAARSLNDSSGLHDAIGQADGGLAQIEQRAEVDELTECLSAGERQVLWLRFEEDLTQQQIGDRLGLSQMSVSRTLRRALRDLRALAEQHGMSAA
jgi:RNA polymerase sigma-B factor